jgi:6-phosphogluconate dehydrogenase
MQIGMVGLGRMGASMAARLVSGGHDVVVYDLDPETVAAATAGGAVGTASLDSFVARLDVPRVAWMMLPSGAATAQTLRMLAALLEPGDTVVDGGNSNYQDTQRRAAELAARGIRLVDVGTSGGIWGLTEGYSLMIGGADDTVSRLRPIFETLAPAADRGWGHVGPSGAGHFVKMIHNGIEYGLMQAYAEGFAVMQRKAELDLDLHQIAGIWQHGSVVRSWLLDLTARALAQDGELKGVAPWVADSGEGRWAVAEAIALDVPAPAMTLALLQRLRSRDDNAFADRLLAALRQEFGGHAIRTGDAPEQS